LLLFCNLLSFTENRILFPQYNSHFITPRDATMTDDFTTPGFADYFAEIPFRL
jgi:hypothetical protein